MVCSLFDTKYFYPDTTDDNQCMVTRKVYTHLDKPAIKLLRFFLICTTFRHKTVNKQKNK